MATIWALKVSLVTLAVTLQGLRVKPNKLVPTCRGLVHHCHVHAIAKSEKLHEHDKLQFYAAMRTKDITLLNVLFKRTQTLR